MNPFRRILQQPRRTGRNPLWKNLSIGKALEGNSFGLSVEGLGGQLVMASNRAARVMPTKSTGSVP
jgi:hypothetical protein